MDDPFETGNFNDLVTWATWQVMEGIAKGEPLRSVMFQLISAIRLWKPKQ